MCSTFSPYASGYKHPPIANKLGDHLWYASHEVLPFHLCLRRPVHVHLRLSERSTKIHNNNGQG